MNKELLIERSPVRIFEKSIHGGLKAGEIGIIASTSAGVGKTSVLVQLALDKLLQEEKVIHVSFSQHTDYVLSWYADIFEEFAGRKNLVSAAEVKDQLIKNRVILNFNQDGVTGTQIVKSLKALIVAGGFKASLIVIDGYDFTRTNRERIEEVKAAAKELGISIWYSCNTVRPCSTGGTGFDTQKIPTIIKQYLDLLDVVIVLEPKADYVELTASKYRDMTELGQMALKLDPKTLLILEG